MNSFTVGQHKYQSRPLDIFDQMIIAKRMMPVLKNIITPEVLGAAMSAQPASGDTPATARLDAAAMLPAIADAIYALSDEDAKHIVNMCLRVVERENKGGIYSALTSPNGSLMFDDLKLMDTLQITWKVIEGHIGDFFSTAP